LQIALPRQSLAYVYFEMNRGAAIGRQAADEG
jgi:hypothetical protein